MARRAVGRRAEVSGTLARRTRSVMAARASGGTRERAVVGLGSGPDRG